MSEREATRAESSCLGSTAPSVEADDSSRPDPQSPDPQSTRGRSLEKKEAVQSPDTSSLTSVQMQHSHGQAVPLGPSAAPRGSCTAETGDVSPRRTDGSDQRSEKEFRERVSDLEPTWQWNVSVPPNRVSSTGSAAPLIAVYSRYSATAESSSLSSGDDSEYEDALGYGEEDAPLDGCPCVLARRAERHDDSSRGNGERRQTARPLYYPPAGPRGQEDLDMASEEDEGQEDAFPSESPEAEDAQSAGAMCAKRMETQGGATRSIATTTNLQTTAPCLSTEATLESQGSSSKTPVEQHLGEKRNRLDAKGMTSSLVANTDSCHSQIQTEAGRSSRDVVSVEDGVGPSFLSPSTDKNAKERVLTESAAAGSGASVSPAQEARTGSSSAEQRRYQPIANSTRRRLATQLHLRISRLESLGSPGLLRKPKQLHNPAEDGNCFFRAISFLLTGRETHHRTLRSKVVGYMRNCISQQLESYLSLSVREYVAESRMAVTGVWATDVEVMAMAAMFGVDIVVFRYCGGQRQWLTYPASFDLQHLSRESIYLQNTGGHFYLVTGV